MVQETFPYFRDRISSNLKLREFIIDVKTWVSSRKKFNSESGMLVFKFTNIKKKLYLLFKFFILVEPKLKSKGNTIFSLPKDFI